MKSTPTREECELLWQRYHTPPNVIDHLNAVTSVAVQVANACLEKELTVDRDLVQAGALLHDFLRYVGLRQFNLRLAKEPPSYEDLAFWEKMNEKYEGQGHDAAATQELAELGYNRDLQRVVEAHQEIIDPDKLPQTLEEKIVYYADKRVRHHEIVSLKERFEDIEARYPNMVNTPEMQLKRIATYEMEQELFAPLNIQPKDIA